MKEDSSMGALVAIYGNKPVELSRLITDCQSQISNMIGAAFNPYDIQQVHATITGIGPAQPSTSFADKQVKMDTDGLINYLHKSGILPFQVQIGGFQKRHYPFVSRGMQPYDRSFSLRDGKALIIGWPIRGMPNINENLSLLDLIQESRIYPTTLDKIRQAAKGFGFLHRYYQHNNDFDNDFYFRIGLFDSISISEAQQEAVEHRIRQFLNVSSPIIIEVNRSNLYFAFSDKETMPPDSTKAWSISDPDLSTNLMSQLQ
jgi:hypothetical protein